MKKKLIENIKKLIAEIGSTSTGEMQSNYSQIYKIMITMQNQPYNLFW